MTAASSASASIDPEARPVRADAAAKRAAGPGGWRPRAGRRPVDGERMLRYRLRRLQQQIAAEGCAGALILGVHNLRYATGTQRSGIYNAHKPSRAAFVPVSGLATAFDWFHPGNPHPTPGIVGELRPMPVFAYFPSGERAWERLRSLAGQVAALARAGGGERIALDISDPGLVHALEAEGLAVVSADRAIEMATAIKNEDEIACLANACDIAGIAMAALHEALAPGMTEAEALSILNRTNTAYGGEWLEYKLLASGERINPWQQEASDRRIRAGELVAFDCGMVGPSGYSADVSRTFFCRPGKPTAAQKRLYALAVENVEHNLALVKAGVSFEDFSRGCWPYPQEFLKHRYDVMAHGIGMGDEWPAIPWPCDWEAHGYEGELRENMVLCIESFIGSEHGGEGVKLEQQVVVTGTGCELLSTFPWEESLYGGAARAGGLSA